MCVCVCVGFDDPKKKICARKPKKPKNRKYDVEKKKEEKIKNKSRLKTTDSKFQLLKNYVSTKAIPDPS